jgi:hypothetical protein
VVLKAVKLASLIFAGPLRLSRACCSPERIRAAPKSPAPASCPAQSPGAHPAPSPRRTRQSDAPFSRRAQRIRQLALRLLTGADNHLINRNSWLAADRDM